MYTPNRSSRDGSNSGRRRTFSPSSQGGDRGKKQFSRSSKPYRGSSNSRSQSGGRGGARSGGRKMSSFDPSQFINKNPKSVDQVAYTPKHTFETFGLDPRISRTIASMGITHPTPIQDQIIPEVLLGRDVVGLAETGTGKTAAFLVPLIQKTIEDGTRQTLILAPTRELALQIEAELRKLSNGFRLFSVICVGGTPIFPQLRSLKKPNHFIIGTPGRVLDLINRKAIRPEHIRTVVLDEADRMLDMGFIHNMKAILADIPSTKETLFFSATMPPAAKDIVHSFLRDPVLVSVKKKDTTDSILQDVVPFEHHEKFAKLSTLLQDQTLSRVIIFGAMKHSVEKLAKELSISGIYSESIHGNKTHGARQRALNAFKSGRARVLVATDVAARGIHVDDISHVINYDLPNTFEDYIHRIGRTGRGSKNGKALTFIPASAIRR